MNKRTRRFLYGGVAALLLTGAVVAGGGLYLLDYALRPDNRGKDIEGSERYMRQTYPWTTAWMDSMKTAQAFRDTFITASDGIRLHALYAAASRPTAQTAVIVHGYTDNAVRMLHIGYLYHHELGFNILLPDLRYSGRSGGDAFQMGWLDRKDVEQWIDTAPALFSDSLRAVVHGISMGAATTMMLSGDSLPPYIRCFVEDCGYTSVWDQFGKELKSQFSLPAFPLLPVASLLCYWQNGWNFKEASALKQVSKCRRPMFFIHGDADDFVPTDMVYPLFEAKPDPKELWVVPGASHARSYQLMPETYTAKVAAFIKEYLHD